MWHKWILIKKEIEKWIDQKLHEFVRKEKWPQRYLYIEAHEFFFSSFPYELYEWLSKLTDSEPTHNFDNPIVWTPELVKRLEWYDYKVVRDIDYWIDSILGSFITEFAIDIFVSYSEVEWWFFKGLRGKYMKSRKTWIKMLLWKKKVMHLH